MGANNPGRIEPNFFVLEMSAT